MVRIYKEGDIFNVQEKVFLLGWVDKTAITDSGDELPCTLTGFDTLKEAYKNAQTETVYIHENCIDWEIDNENR